MTSIGSGWLCLALHEGGKRAIIAFGTVRVEGIYVAVRLLRVLPHNARYMIND